jgi:phage-related protein
VSWRIAYHITVDAVVILDVFKKQSEATPLAVIGACKKRLGEYERLTKRKEARRAKG